MEERVTEEQLKGDDWRGQLARHQRAYDDAAARFDRLQVEYDRLRVENEGLRAEIDRLRAR